MEISKPIYIETNHLAMLLSPGAWLVDTGSDVSFGDVPVVQLAKEPYDVPKFIGTFTIEKLRAATRCNYVGLLGNDILGNFDVVLNLTENNCKSGWAHFYDRNIQSQVGHKVELDFVANTRTPTVFAGVDNENVRMIFDTGAQYSYLASLEGLETKHLGTSTDFVITAQGPVAFDIDLHEVKVKLGSIVALLKFATEPGKLTCPDRVDKLLKMTRVGGILGWEILKHGPMAYLPRRGELWI